MTFKWLKQKDLQVSCSPIRTRWKADSKFVLKRVGADPSWRARLGNLMIHDQRSSPGSTPVSSRKVNHILLIHN